MGKPTTHVLLVTDKSGSMAVLAGDVRGGFNTYVDELRAAKKNDGGRYRITATLFDTTMNALCTAAKLSDVPALTELNYQPGGFTALLDAVGTTIRRFEADVTLEPDDRVLLVIQTDGEENSSREYKWEQIRDMLEAREKTGQWSIVYLGQGADAWAQGHRFGASTQVVNAAYSPRGTQASYTGLAAATVALATTGKGDDVGATVAATAGINDD